MKATGARRQAEHCRAQPGSRAGPRLCELDTSDGALMLSFAKPCPGRLESSRKTHVSSTFQHWKQCCFTLLSLWGASGGGHGLAVDICAFSLRWGIARGTGQRIVRHPAPGFMLGDSLLRGEIRCLGGRAVGAKQGSDRGRHRRSAALPEGRDKPDRQGSNKAVCVRLL
jgi:hypothetical protein